MRSTLLAYKGWEVEQGKTLDTKSSDLDGIPSHVASAYHKALEMYNARIHLEEQISRQDVSDSERLQQFMVCSIQNCYSRNLNEYFILEAAFSFPVWYSNLPLFW